MSTRGYVFLIDETGETVSNVNEWCSEKVSPLVEVRQLLPRELFKWVFLRLELDGNIEVDDISDLPSEAAEFKAEWEKTGVLSFLIFPLKRGNDLVGFLGFDNMLRGEEWASIERTLLSVVSDITGGALARVRGEQEIERMAFRDPLTNLPNRRLFEDRIIQALARAARRRRLVAILFLDLDKFKQVNDEFGHEAGDLLLQSVARRLTERLRGQDTIARLGGDEFNIVLSDIKSEAELGSVAEQIVEWLSQPIEVRGYQVKTHASIGISVYPKDGEAPEVLLRKADMALYQAKAIGGDTYTFFEEPAKGESSDKAA